MTDQEQLRAAFSTFLTGVTVVTTRAADGSPVGFTANSFTSVSLDPPLLLVCLSNTLNCLDAFERTESFAVNILSANQQDVSNTFAAYDGDRFEQISHHGGKTTSPLLDNCSAWFDCQVHQRVAAGDHTIYIGRILDYQFEESDPLGYSRQGYFSLQHEQLARQLHVASPDVVTGYLIEVDDCLIVQKHGDNYKLPETKAGQSLEQLHDALQLAEIEHSVGMLYSMFQFDDRGSHAVYYRCRANRGPSITSNDFQCLPIADLPLESFKASSVRSMLQRFKTEHATGTYGIYHGTESAGNVTMISAENSHARKL